MKKRFQLASAFHSSFCTLTSPLLREFYGEGRARPEFGFDRSFAAVGSRQVLDDCKAKACSPLGARACAVYSIEALEDARQVFARYAFARVRDVHAVVRSRRIVVNAHRATLVT